MLQILRRMDIAGAGVSTQIAFSKVLDDRILNARFYDLPVRVSL